ncbi:LOW QUALITY PROTEIN: interleukin-5 receptor subunit alpha [Phaethornis superciliosus]
MQVKTQKVNVPRNVTVFLEENDLLAPWEKPISPFPKECFEYEFYLFNLKSGNKQILKIPSNDFRLWIDVTSKYSIQIRANHHICSKGFWSEIIYVGKNAMLLSSSENPVWSKLFPPIPTPRNKFRDPSPNNYEKAHTCTTETQLGSFAEDLSCSVLDDSLF